MGYGYWVGAKEYIDGRGRPITTAAVQQQQQQNVKEEKSDETLFSLRRINIFFSFPLRLKDTHTQTDKKQSTCRFITTFSHLNISQQIHGRWKLGYASHVYSTENAQHHHTLARPLRFSFIRNEMEPGAREGAQSVH